MKKFIYYVIFILAGCSNSPIISDSDPKFMGPPDCRENYLNPRC